MRRTGQSNFQLLRQLFSFRDVRNAILGFSVVVGGLSLAFVTLYAHQTGNTRLAGMAAGASLDSYFRRAASGAFRERGSITVESAF
jgi:hypothetical protein